MSSDNGRYIALVLDECRTRIQTISELLLLSSSPRPVFTKGEDLSLQQETFVLYRDRVIAQLNKMLILARDVASQVHGKHISWKQLSQRVQELSNCVVSLSELSAHIAYLAALNMEGSSPAMLGPVRAVHSLTSADLDMRFCCTRLKRSRMNDLQPHLMVDLCASITKALTSMSDICRQAADAIKDTNDQDQFKLCVKVITSSTGCLVSSIKSFKAMATQAHLRRVVTFCDPVTAASSALLSFATETDFIGSPASFTTEGLELYKSLLGLSMSLASATVQICKAVRDLLYSSTSKRHKDRVSLCVESITRSASQMRDFLLSHEFDNPSASLSSFLGRFNSSAISPQGIDMFITLNQNSVSPVDMDSPLKSKPSGEKSSSKRSSRGSEGHRSPKTLERTPKHSDKSRSRDNKTGKAARPVSLPSPEALTAASSQLTAAARTTTATSSPISSSSFSLLSEDGGNDTNEDQPFDLDLILAGSTPSPVSSNADESSSSQNSTSKFPNDGSSGNLNKEGVKVGQVVWPLPAFPEDEKAALSMIAESNLPQEHLHLSKDGVEKNDMDETVHEV